MGGLSELVKRDRRVVSGGSRRAKEMHALTPSSSSAQSRNEQRSHPKERPATSCCLSAAAQMESSASCGSELEDKLDWQR